MNMSNMKQLIIARKDLNMSPGKLAAQVSHASMAFLTTQIQNHKLPNPVDNQWIIALPIDLDVYEEWICGSFTKIICKAKNKYQLEKIMPFARELGLEEGKDFFLIKDACLTELEPEEDGHTLTCIGFRPLPDDICAQLSKKY